MDRTVRLALRPTAEQAAALTETCHQFTAVFNMVCAHGWRERQKNGVSLHHALYHPLKARYPALVSDHHIQARVKATEAVRSALALLRKGRRATQPRSTACPPRYNVHTFKVDWTKGLVNLATTQGRMRLPFTVPAYAARYVGHQVCTADLLEREGHWWLHVVVTVPAPELAASDEVVGVDLGLAQPAVTSTARFLGKRRWRDREARLFRRKRALQAKGTKSAKRHLTRLRQKQARFRRDCDHVLSKQVVQACAPGGTIVLENLNEIRSRVRPRHGAQSRRLHSWSFAQLTSLIGYKAEERGCTVVSVDPRHTSQACSRCGYQARNNRRSRGWFWCRACGFQLHADLNAARNIAAKSHAGGSMPAAGGPFVKRPLVDPDGPAVGHRGSHKLTPSGVSP